ncbi:MAG: nickel-responsive transcriptional regulator NikR [Calditrichaeota bacterium]|nr:nickel-responsive transcriptional regulator NikR [Calditrichota bacterium]
MRTVRFGVSLPENLIRNFDEWIRSKQYPNRSEAIRDLIRKALIDEAVQSDQVVLGVLNIVYDHHKRALSDELAHLQHDYYHLIISVTHVHLDHDNCLEVILLKGKARDVQRLSDKIIALKGVKHGKLYVTSVQNV